MAETLDMSPDASPNRPAVPAGVRRMNNLPIYLICGVMAIFLLIMALVAADRAEKQQRLPEPSESKAASTNTFATEIAGSQKDGIVPAANASPLIPPENAPNPPGATVARPEMLEPPPTPPATLQSSPPSQEQDTRTRIAQEKMHMLEEAAKAKTIVQAAAPRSAASAPTGMQRAASLASKDELSSRFSTAQQQSSVQYGEDPTTTYQARLQQLQQAGIVPPGGSGGDATGSSSSQQGSQIPSPSGKNYGQFDAKGQQDRWYLDSQVQAPRTPYELRAGFVLPAILISGINSDLPGQVMGQVSQDVFDTATGKWRLIPQGSRLVGEYSSDIAYGQARVLIAWQRIIFPDGKALDIGVMPGADSAGYSGFHDQVNNHYLRLFGSALLMSGVTAGIALSQPDSMYVNRQSARSAMSEALGQQLGHVTAQMIARNMGISPTLEIRPGYRFNVVVTKDLTFSKPYKAFDY